tara:strand:+ start:602 stop:850 length:249 start_codon:yes stop_codon:yes gene_type:complete
MTQTVVRGYTENSGSITIQDDLNGDITIVPSGTGDVDLGNGTGNINCSSSFATDVKTTNTKKVYSKGNCVQTGFHSSLIFSF